MGAVDDREMPRLEFEVGARRDFVRNSAEIFRCADREPRLAQQAAARAKHAEVAGENVAARHEIGRLHRGAGDDWGERGAADHILAGIRGDRDDEADAETPGCHDAHRPTDPRPTHTRPAHM